MNRFISYDGLPISSGGAHSVNKRLPLENYNKTVKFLEQFGDKTFPESIELELYQSDKNEYSTLKLVPKLSLKFGFPKFRSGGRLKSWYWNLTEKDIQNGFDALELNKKLPKNSLGPITLSFLWNFKFKDPKTNQNLPNQEKIPELDFRIQNSRIYLRTSNKSTISVWFALPFEQLGSYESEYISNLKSLLPFKVSEKHWRVWKKSDKGNWTPRKLEIKNAS